MARHARLRFLQHGDRRADLSWSAVAALEPVMLDEDRLERMQRVGRADALDGHDLVAVVHHREREARVYASSIQQHGASTALAVIATLFGARQVQMLAQRVEERRANVELEIVRVPVDLECDGVTRTGCATLRRARRRNGARLAADAL